MRKLFALILLCISCPAFAATWFATSSSVNINAASLWVPTQGASCAGSGTPLTWGNQVDGDVFNANGCTALAVNVDPGGASVHVTLTTDTTNGGGFTYATAANITIHAHLTATHTTALTITGSTGGGTIIGNSTGGNTNNTSGISDSHTVVTVNLTGNLQGGSATNTYGYGYGAATGTVSITGNATGGSGANSVGVNLNNGTATVTGNCIGGTSYGNSNGCNGISTGALTVVGNNIDSLFDVGIHGHVFFTPAATNYSLMSKDASYTTGTIDAHATEMPTNPGVGNVSSGVNYGSFTGTLVASGGGICAIVH